MNNSTYLLGTGVWGGARVCGSTDGKDGGIEGGWGGWIMAGIDDGKPSNWYGNGLPDIGITSPAVTCKIHLELNYIYCNQILNKNIFHVKVVESVLYHCQSHGTLPWDSIINSAVLCIYIYHKLWNSIAEKNTSWCYMDVSVWKPFDPRL